MLTCVQTDAKSFRMLHRWWYDVTLCSVFSKNYNQHKTFNLIHFPAALQFYIFYFNSDTRSCCDILICRWSHVMRIHRPEFTKFELWNVAKCKTLHGLAFPVWLIRMRMNGSQWNKKKKVIIPLFTIFICLASVVVCFGSFAVRIFEITQIIWQSDMV